MSKARKQAVATALCERIISNISTGVRCWESFMASDDFTPEHKENGVWIIRLDMTFPVADAVFDTAGNGMASNARTLWVLLDEEPTDTLFRFGDGPPNPKTDVISKETINEAQAMARANKTITSNHVVIVKFKGLRRGVCLVVAMPNKILPAAMHAIGAGW
jgi:hypothetical protein